MIKFRDWIVRIILTIFVFISLIYFCVYYYQNNENLWNESKKEKIEQIENMNKDLDLFLGGKNE